LEQKHEVRIVSREAGGRRAKIVFEDPKIAQVTRERVLVGVRFPAQPENVEQGIESKGVGTWGRTEFVASEKESEIRVIYVERK
jgi:hypothetical protein